MFDRSLIQTRTHRRSLRLLGVTGLGVFSVIALAILYSFTIGTRMAGAKITTITVCASGCDHTTLQAAVAAATNGDTINVGAGTYVLASTVNVNVANLTIAGASSATTIVQVAQAIGNAFNITAAGVTISDLQVQKTDVTGVHELIFINTGANNFKLQNCLIQGPDPGTPWSVNGIVSRGMVTAAGALTGIIIQNNTIKHLRQPAYFNPGTVASVLNNNVSGTRGWVVDGAKITFTGNTWGPPANQGADIALLASCNPADYPNLGALSNANSNAFISGQFAGASSGVGTVYVDDSAAPGGDGTQALPFQTIAAGITAVLPGGIVNVADGTYVENPSIAKSLTLQGANAGTAGSATRGPESIIRTNGNQTAVVGVTAANVTINGFTIDGDDPGLAGAALASGDDSNVQYGVRPTATVGNLTVSNNIIKKVFIGLRGDVAGQGNVVTANWFDSIGNFDFGYAVSIRNNYYANVTNNKMTRAWTGVHINNHNGAGGPASFLITGNEIHSYAGGILYWLQYNQATGATISGNTITAETGAVANNFGILVVSNQDAVNSTFTSNAISGHDYGVGLFNVPTSSTITLGATNSITGSKLAGVLLTDNLNFNPVGTTNFLAGGPGAASTVNITNLPITGNVNTGIKVEGFTNLQTLNITGSTVSGGTTGLLMTGTKTALAGNTLNNLAFSGQSGDYITLANSALDNLTINATAVTFNGLTGATATSAQNFAIENKIFHALDDSSLGLINFASNTLFVSSTGASGSTPTASNNDYTRINNAVQNAASGATVKLNGTFDWTEANASASWAKGSNGIAGDIDDYSIYVPANRNNVTFTANTLGDATIQGPGDVATVDLEGVFFFDGGPNQGWTISNTRFVDFDLAIGFFSGGGGVTAYNNTKILNNYVKVAKDLNATAAPGDSFQNIGIYYSYGTNQMISGNTIEFDGDGVSDSANNNFSTQVGMQCDTSGGNVYEGLQITNNTLRVLNAQSADPQIILGIWENAHAHLSNLTISDNSFTNLAGGNNPVTNLQRAFRVTSHSSPTTTVKYQNNTVSGANTGFQWRFGPFTGNQPVQLISNTLIGNNTGVLVAEEGLALLKFNRFVGNLAAGLSVTNTTAINITAENNWWGCNYGPGTGGAGCSGTPNGVNNTSPGTVDTNPWLVLGLSASPSTVAVGGMSGLTASLKKNSDDVDTSLMGMGTFPDGVTVNFAGTLGTVMPASATTASAVASSTYTAGGTPGAGSASSTVDGQTVTQPITVTVGPLATLSFVQQPTNTVISGTITPAVTVQAKDAFNNNISGVSVTLSLSMGTGTLGGTLTQVTNGSGIATFSNLSLDTAGSGKKLTATSGAITAVSNPFTILPIPPIVYVDDDWSALTAGTDPDGAGPATSIGYDAFATIQNGVNAVATNGQVIVSAGTYIEDVGISRTMIVSGAGPTSIISGAIGGPGSTVAITANNVELKGFKITREGNTAATWNDPNLNSAGVSIASSVTGITVHDNLFVQNRTGIDINNSSGHTVRNNVLTDNRTGMIFRNQTDNLTVVENEITNNWTVGILFLDGTGGTSNSPLQQALNCTFSNNNVSANWYGQIVDRQSSAFIPTPGTTNLKDFSANWFGSNAPVVTTANSTEPGYTAQIPFTVPGGSATPPGGQPDIAGPASANFDITPLLDVGTDTNVETTLGRGTYGFQGSFNVLDVIATNAQTGATGRIQEGVNLVSTGGTVKALAGSYTENVNVNKAATLLGTPTINGTLATSVAGAKISPGFSPGIINSGDLSLVSGSTLSIETVSNAGPGTGHDQINVTGTVNLGSATLDVINSFTPAGGTSFTIINNDGADAVTGTFNGLPEGAVFMLGGSFFRITYAGGSNNNDVILTANIPPQITAGPALSRQQGSPASNSQIATASDTEDAANTLSIQVSGDGGMSFGNSATNNGVTVVLTDGNAGAGGINPDAMGKIFADVVASCAATNASFTISVTDSGTLTVMTVISVLVTANTPPVLSYTTPQMVMPGQSLNVNPVAPPSDNGSVASIVVQSVSAGFTGTVTVNPAGVVMINNAGPAGSYTITIRATDNCGGVTGTTDASFVLNVNCPTITVNPPTLPNGFVGTLYNQPLSAAGGTPSYTFTLFSGTLPNGVNIVGSSLMGTPTTTGTFNFTLKATDSLNCIATRAYTVIISGSGLQFYPLAHPVRLVDTRIGASACQAQGAPITGGTSLTVPSRVTCDSLTIPANAAAITGNITTVGPVANGFLTVYPSSATQPQAANTNYQAGQTLNNVFTVGLGAADGAFKVFALQTTDVVIDITGYFAPPGAGGLFFHPLPAPVRLLDTRAKATACTTPGTPLLANTEFLQQGNAICGIPGSAVALVGNATTVGPAAQGFLTLFPANETRPVIASGNYQSGQTLNSPFTVGLSPSGNFTIYSLQQTNLVIDVTGYYSADASDVIGIGLLFSPMTPSRLLDTRSGQSACFMPGSPIPAMTETPQAARGECAIPATAQAIVGNATTVTPAAQGFLTFWPSDAARPNAATSNFAAGVNFNRHYTVGLGADGAFKIYALTSTHLVIDVSGSFAP